MTDIEESQKKQREETEAKQKRSRAWALEQKEIYRLQ
jgi:hypothetical protein